MEDTGDTLKVEFFVTPQQTLVEGFQDAAWDHALAAAHAQGVIPVGPIHLEQELVKGTAGGLVEGQPMQVGSLADLLQPPAHDLVKVTATMMIGSRMDP